MDKDIWPNFFIVGAARSGTTSLYEYLSRVPQVYMPSIKEPHYFAPSVPTKSPISSSVIHEKQKYLQLYKDVKNEDAIGDASPSYLWDSESPKLIHEVIPTARVIMILRDPIERAYSHYLMNLHEGWENLSFYDALQKDYNRSNKGYFVSHLYVEAGMYSEQVERYLKIFNTQKVKVLIFEEFVENTTAAVKDVLRFLGIEPNYLPNNLNLAYNSHSYVFPQRKKTVGKALFGSKYSSIFRTKIKPLVPDSIWDIMKENILPIRDRLIETSMSKKEDKLPLPENAKIFLKDIYRDDVIKLKSILGRDLPWKHFTKN